jgi:hypothetical protein
MGGGQRKRPHLEARLRVLPALPKCFPGSVLPECFPTPFRGSREAGSGKQNRLSNREAEALRVFSAQLATRAGGFDRDTADAILAWIRGARTGA